MQELSRNQRINSMEGLIDQLRWVSCSFRSIIMQQDHYCQHFQNLKLTKNIDLQGQIGCKYCLAGRNYLWLCLAKSCGVLVCDRNHREHIKLHLEQSKGKKLFHSIFINILTAQIVCIHCDIQIFDLDIAKADRINDPYPFRLKILPSLGDFDLQKTKIMGQLENSEGHKKISKALTGFFSNRSNYAINSALQFLMQFELFRQILFSMKKSNKQIEQVSKIFDKAYEADLRAIHTDELIKVMVSDNPELLGYKRKDPFQHVLHFMTRVHESIKYYSLDLNDIEYDQWQLLGDPATASKPILNCPLFDNATITLLLNYSCQKCQRKESLPADINFLKVSFPKKKRKAKEVQKQLSEHRFESPLKNRRKSLLNLFKPEEECPFTLPELIIDFLKQPRHKDRICAVCKQEMKKQKLSFDFIPQYLLIQVNRMGADGNSVDQTKLQFPMDSIDLGSFCPNKKTTLIYNFQTALCIENVCSYPVIARSRFNKQIYIFKNQLVTMLKTDKNLPNPYIICYKRQCIDEAKLRDCYHNIKSNTQIQEHQQTREGLMLPDFWLCQLKCLIAKPLKNQLVCRHDRIRPGVHSKMQTIQRVPSEVYDYLIETFRGKPYTDSICFECENDLLKLNDRKKYEKEKVIQYEKLRSACFCMVSTFWVKKWMKFLYKKGEFTYFGKGQPMPGPIDNKSLLDGQKCKANMRKNEDYKVVNVFIWRFLKQLYGGGPEIRYKWVKRQMSEEEEQKIKEIKAVANQIKQLYLISYVESPRKNLVIEKTTSLMDSVKGSEDNQSLSVPEQIQ